jgi:hypothetical protein
LRDGAFALRVGFSMPKRVTKPIMVECEMRRVFKIAGVKSARWIVRPVQGITPTPNSLRCMHCKGPVRFRKQKFADGPADHVDHVNRADSETCEAGQHFLGTHAESASPVL